MDPQQRRGMSNCIWFMYGHFAIKLVTLFDFSSEVMCITSCKTGSDLLTGILSFAPVNFMTEWSSQSIFKNLNFWAVDCDIADLRSLYWITSWIFNIQDGHQPSLQISKWLILSSFKVSSIYIKQSCSENW